AVLVGAAVTVRAADEKYASKEGKFAIQFPSGAEVKTDTRKVKGTQATVSLTSTEVGGVSYAVGDTDLTVTNVAAKTLLDGPLKANVKQLGENLDSSKEITVGKAKYPGREYVVEKDCIKMKYRIILVESRMYTLAVGGGMDFATSDDAAKFLD